MARLETFTNRHPGRDYDRPAHLPRVHLGVPEDGPARLRHDPDHATCPDRRCVELKSLKLYLQAYRNKGIFYEDVVNVILDDLVAALTPRRLTVEGDFRVRGGISSVVTATYEAPAKGRGRKR